MKNNGCGSVKIDRQDLYHGAALLQIINDRRGAIVSRIPPEPYYRVSVGTARRGQENRYLYLKYVSRNAEPFRFSFSNHERQFLETQFTRPDPVFIGLVCSSSYVCVLDEQQYSKLAVEPDRLILLIKTPERGKIRVQRWGTRMRPLLVSHSAFPNDVLS